MSNSVYSMVDRDNQAEDNLFRAIKKSMIDTGNPLASVSGSVFSQEGTDDPYILDSVRITLEEVNTNLTSILGQYSPPAISMESDGSMSSNSFDQQLKSAQYAAIMASSREARAQVLNALATEESRPVDITSSQLGGEPNSERVISMESFDESDNSTSLSMTIAYNFRCPRQNEFSEAFFPLFVTQPDTAVFEVCSDILSIAEVYKHSVDGSYKYDFARKSLTLAMVDPSILNNDTTLNIPEYRETVEKIKESFADKAVVKPFYYDMENGNRILTAALKPGKEFDLFSLCSSDYLIGTNTLDNTDQLDPAVYLQTIWIKFKNNDVVKFTNLDVIPEAGFVRAVNGQGRDMTLNFSHRWLRIDKNTKTDEDKAIKFAATLSTDDISVDLRINFSAEVNLDTSLTSSTVGAVAVSKMFNSSGIEILPQGATKATYDTVAAQFEGAEIVGYYLKSRRINTNRREIGQLIDLNTYRVNYQMPTLAPVSIQRPANETDAAINRRIEALAVATYARCNLNAVNVLQATARHLAQLPKAYDTSLVYNSKVLGAGRFYVTPYFNSARLDVYQQMQTLQSSSRIVDVNAVLINYLRDEALRMYQESNYAAAQQVIEGSDSRKPVLIIGTDYRIASYLQLIGDTRTFSEVFKHKVVWTFDLRMRDKIYLTFGREGATTKNDLLNPLHFGNCVVRPEFTTVLNVTRNGRIVKEITSQPSFVHIPHLPVLSEVIVTNLSKAVREIVPIKHAP